MTSGGRGSSSEKTEPTAGYVAIGKAGATRGLHGEFRVDILTDFPDRFEGGRSLYIKGDRYIIEKANWIQDKLFLKLSGIDNADVASALRHRLLEIPESELTPLGEGEFYRYQLIGLPVRATTGLPLGRIQEIINTGSNDVYVVYGMMGEILLPATSDVIKKIDLDVGFMEIEMMPGLIQPRKKRGDEAI
jgi:16S rRNA processing protein RimM